VDEQESNLPSALTPRICTDLTLGVRQAYADICRTHDSKIGNDSVTFGISVSRAVWYRLGQRFEGHEIAEVEHPDGGFELLVDGLRIHPFKLGNTTQDNVWTSFPWNQRSANAMASINVEQIGLGLVGQPRRFVLGHFGGPQGFAKLYICVPMFDRGKIFQWASAVRIDDLDAGAQPAQRPTPAPIAPPRVQLRPVPVVSEPDHGETADPSDA
jgi:hypothetical protein